VAQRDLLLRDLAALDARESDDEAHLDRLAALLGSIAHLWHEAEPTQRNQIARLLFDEVIIKDQQVTAVKPRPALAGFFALDGQVRGECCKRAAATGFQSAPLQAPRSTADLAVFPCPGS
jgi:hypothetical protein